MDPWLTKQADLFETSEAARERRLRELVEKMGEVAGSVTIKEVAYAAGLSPATVKNSLDGRDRKAPPLKLFEVLVHADPERRLLRWLADRYDLDLVLRQHRTPEEELAALKLALQAQGPVGRVIARQAGVSI